MDQRRKLRDKAKRSAETVQSLRREVAQHEKSGLIPETAVSQVKVPARQLALRTAGQSVEREEGAS